MRKQIIEETKNFCTLYRNLFSKADNDKTSWKCHSKIVLVLSGNFTGILIPIADFHTFKIKCENIVKGRQEIDISFLKASFSKTFRFKRRGQLRILILINTKQNENFKFVHNFAE